MELKLLSWRAIASILQIQFIALAAKLLLVHRPSHIYYILCMATNCMIRKICYFGSLVVILGLNSGRRLLQSIVCHAVSFIYNDNANRMQ